jgi:hypothetical protein
MEDLKSMTVSDTVSRGVKKLIMELTSVKFLTMVFIGAVTYLKVIDGYVGIMGLLAILGIREGKEFLENRLGSLPNRQ